ncbi:hypothetical protein [Pseudaquabacterium pictum]|uniref:Uncharacterized protein n=1 Tax=Pseudaquabacterium pictum TaxID=2315236 RepID=A0A480AL86_9BURK|nr:hypothetical protein [Rubrivivax pictus]GCL61490.1 hypothetical protein AQPW35_05710 [Rubrivivax pictus]
MASNPTTQPSTDAAAEPFDILAFEDAEAADLRIKHPITGAPTTMVVQLAGPEHPVRRRIVLARQRRMRAQLAQTGELQVTDPEEDELDELELLVACTLGWRGAAQPYSPAAARDAFNDPRRRWLRDQVQRGLKDRQFFTRSCVPG